MKSVILFCLLTLSLLAAGCGKASSATSSGCVPSATQGCVVLNSGH